jgi:hypothetical protein
MHFYSNVMSFWYQKLRGMTAAFKNVGKQIIKAKNQS